MSKDPNIIQRTLEDENKQGRELLHAKVKELEFLALDIKKHL